MTFSKPRYRGFPSGSMVKSLPANAVDAGDTVQSQDPEDPLEEEMATYFSILPWRIPWTEEPGGLQSKVSHRVGHNLRQLSVHA